MTEEELDQVAGGQRYVYLYYGVKGIEYTKFSFEGDIDKVKKLLAGGSVLKFDFDSFLGHGTISTQERLEKYTKKWKEEGRIIIKQWEQ